MGKNEKYETNEKRGVPLAIITNCLAKCIWFRFHCAEDLRVIKTRNSLTLLQVGKTRDETMQEMLNLATVAVHFNDS